MHTWIQLFEGVGLGLFIGFVCRYFDIPSPAPPKLVGALLVLAMTLGFMAGGHFVKVG